jgi:hypothetical protein
VPMGEIADSIMSVVAKEEKAANANIAALY